MNRIANIEINFDGSVWCESRFYRVDDLVSCLKTYRFRTGVNFLKGDIDSGNWAVSYFVSMYDSSSYHQEGKWWVDECTARINGNPVQLEELTRQTCYLEKTYPLFSTHRSVYELVADGIRQNGLPYTPEQICGMFEIYPGRFEREIEHTGNEQFKARAAIGFCHNKQVFCFPWMSKRRYDAFHLHMPHLLRILKRLGKIAIVPIGK